MLFMRKSIAMPSAAEALPGRATPIPTARFHFVNGHALQPPYPEGLQTAYFGLGCFWGAERKFWAMASMSPRSATLAGTRRTRRMKKSAPDTRAIPKLCWWCSIRRRSHMKRC